MKLIYVSGPYRDSTEWGRILNIRNAEMVAIECWQRGWAVICPHKNTEHFGGILPDQAWMDGDLEMIRRCDAMCMVEGWKTSEGAKLERAEAKRIGIPIYENAWKVPCESKKE